MKTQTLVVRRSASTFAADAVVVAVAVAYAVQTWGGGRSLIAVVWLLLLVPRLLVAAKADEEGLSVRNAFGWRRIPRSDVMGFRIESLRWLPFEQAVHVLLPRGATMPIEATRRLVIGSLGKSRLEEQLQRLRAWAP